MTRTKRRLVTDSQRTPESIVEIMSEGNEETKEFLKEYIQNEEHSLVWIDVLDNYQIYGENIIKFFKMCCNASRERFTATLLDLDVYTYGDYYDQRKMVKASLRDEVALAVVSY